MMFTRRHLCVLIAWLAFWLAFALIGSALVAHASTLTVRQRAILAVSKPVIDYGFALSGKVGKCHEDACELTSFQIKLHCTVEGDSTTGTCVAFKVQVSHGAAKVNPNSGSVSTQFGQWRTTTWAEYDTTERAAMWEYNLLRLRIMQ